ncbi:MAG: hypothetical protein ACN0LA_09960 [Candidatus Longimicrobiales bacterium M2_2A_002]
MATTTRSAAEVRQEIEAHEERLDELQERESDLGAELEEARNALGRATAHGAAAKSEKAAVRDLAEELEATTRAIGILQEELEGLAGARDAALIRETGEVARRRTEETLEAAEEVARQAHAFLEEFAPLLDRLDARFNAEKKAEIQARQARGAVGAYTQTSAKAELWNTHRPLFGFIEAVRQFEKASDGAPVDPAA